MMTGDRIAATAVSRRPSHDVRQRSIRLNEIEIRRRDVFELKPEISDQRHALQKHFGQGYR